jgi:N-acetyl-alpha-D-glucosaminyl L-malate synthase BshA
VKRVSDVVDIFALVAKKIPSRLIFVGEGPELCKIIAKVKELGLTDRVAFCGTQDDVAQIISLADVNLLPSEKESFGLVALEAMACGVPTVASNAGGIPELITHGESGYLANVGDTETMVNYTLKLLTDRELYARMVEACQYRARFTFCNDLIRKQYEEIYYRVLGREMPEEMKLEEPSC